MNYLYEPNHFGNPKLGGHDNASWPAIVDLLPDIVAHRERLALKRKVERRWVAHRITLIRELGA
jgi:hypothetical protein